MKKFMSIVLVIALTAVTFVACSTETPGIQQASESASLDANSSTESESVDDTAEGSEIVIGVTLQNMSEEFMTMLKGAMEKQLGSYDNVKLVINDAEGKSDKQTSQLESFVAQKVDAIVICPVDADAMTSGVKSAVDAGIPCITVSADVSSDVGQIWVGSENENGGEIEMAYVAEKLGGKGSIAILRGPLGAFAEQGRFAGYETVLAANPELVVAFDQTGNWQREEAMALVENWLTTGTQIDAIVCQNDGMALGALEAVKAAGKKDEIIITGIDAIEDALNSVKAGELDATCFQDAIGQGTAALDMAVKAANGEKISRNNIPFELVTQDNVDGYYDRIKLTA